MHQLVCPFRHQVHREVNRKAISSIDDYERVRQLMRRTSRIVRYRTARSTVVFPVME